MTSSQKTRMASVSSAGHSTSRGEATTHPDEDRLRIPRTPALVTCVTAVTGERLGRLMMATARLV